MLLASAHVGVTGTVTTQDGSWATASRSNTGHYSISMSGFSAAPTCTCTAVSSQQVQCSPRAIIQPDMLEVEIWAEPSTPLLDAAFDVICVGPTL